MLKVSKVLNTLLNKSSKAVPKVSKMVFVPESNCSEMAAILCTKEFNSF